MKKIEKLKEINYNACKKYRDKNKDKVLEYQNQYREKNKEKLKQKK